MQAALEGLIDFRTARPTDPQWWTRYNLIIGAMERRNTKEIEKLAFDLHRSLLGNSQLTAESFDENQNSAQEGYWNIVGYYRPWEGRDYRDRKNKEFTEYRQAYKEMTGYDPRSPEFKAWEDQQIRKLHEYYANEAGKMTDQEKVVEAMRKKYHQGRK